MQPNPPPFTVDDYNNCTWGANCGPGALAGILNITLDEVRPHMGDFEKKHYTNIRLMLHALNSLKVKHKLLDVSRQLYPIHGLSRIQWCGPWTESTAYPTTRLRHSHWIAVHQDYGQIWIFDINCLCVGGWILENEWRYKVVPWLLSLVEPKANGFFYPTHILELKENIYH